MCEREEGSYVCGLCLRLPDQATQFGHRPSSLISGAQRCTLLALLAACTFVDGCPRHVAQFGQATQ
jgi:hypothetical protein